MCLVVAEAYRSDKIREGSKCHRVLILIQQVLDSWQFFDGKGVNKQRQSLGVDLPELSKLNGDCWIPEENMNGTEQPVAIQSQMWKDSAGDRADAKRSI